MFRDKKYRILTFCDKKYHILTFVTYLTGVERSLSIFSLFLHFLGTPCPRANNLCYPVTLKDVFYSLVSHFDVALGCGSLVSSLGH